MSKVKLLNPVVTIKSNLEILIEDCIIEIPYSRLYYDEVDDLIETLSKFKKECEEINDNIPVKYINIEEYRTLITKLNRMVDEANEK